MHSKFSQTHQKSLNIIFIQWTHGLIDLLELYREPSAKGKPTRGHLHKFILLASSSLLELVYSLPTSPPPFNLSDKFSNFTTQQPQTFFSSLHKIHKKKDNTIGKFSVSNAPLHHPSLETNRTADISRSLRYTLQFQKLFSSNFNLLLLFFWSS